MKQICVIGVGYVGLVTAACFADLGNRVVALDVDDKRVENLKKGIMPIYEMTNEDAALSHSARVDRAATCDHRPASYTAHAVNRLRRRFSSPAGYAGTGRGTG